ncbi:unnamed protein product [Rhizoctonia solani]|uniref:Uncharacterized protein n=1 Tax=Rhizoctonia solani TaxID=456999 RepID=A0A8H2XZB6_9AGAM|nr:unnamed protein product [Rhizoctonia solani]
MIEKMTSPSQPRIIQPPPFAHLVPRPNPPPAIPDAVIDPALRNLVPGEPIAGNIVNNVVDRAQNVPKAQYMVDVTHHFIKSFPSHVRGRPDQLRKTHEVKTWNIEDLETVSRVDFVNQCLSTHELEDDFRASSTRGPPFKISWTGSSGGKAGARTFETDEEFNIYRRQFLDADKTGKNMTIAVSFDTEEMDAFRAKKRICGAADAPDAPAQKITRVEQAEEASQINGKFILMLKATHKCADHPGEHGEPGHCFVTQTGEHLGLNMRRLSVWSAAMAAGEATRYVPPNLPEFDGVQVGGLAAPKPRGRAPTCSSASLSPPGSIDTSLILVAALVPVISTLVQRCEALQMPSPLPAYPSATAVPVASTSQVMLDGATPPSPPSTPDSHIKDCLVAFKAKSGIDLLRHVDALKHRDLTPNVIPKASPFYPNFFYSHI